MDTLKNRLVFSWNWIQSFSDIVRGIVWDTVNIKRIKEKAAVRNVVIASPSFALFVQIRYLQSQIRNS